MDSCGYSMRRFCYIKKHLIPLKAVVFFVYAGIFSLTPFLNDQSKYLGVSIPEKTLLFAAILLASSLGPPITGLITDKSRHLKFMLISVLILTMLSHNFLLIIPGISVDDKPVQSNLLFTKTGSYLFLKTCSFPDIRCPVEDSLDNFTIGFQSCQILCKNPKDSAPVLPETEYENVTMNSTLAPRYDDLDVCFWKDENFERSSQCKPFIQLMTTPFENFTLLSTPRMYKEKKQCIYKIITASWKEENVVHPYCPNTPPGCSRLNCEINLQDYNETRLTCPTLTGKPITSYYSYIILRLICFGLIGASLSLIEVNILIKIQVHDSKYGQQRVWSFLAKAIFVPLTAYFMNVAGSYGEPTYFPAFLLFDFFLLIAIILVIFTLSVELESIYSKPSEVHEIKFRWRVLFLFFNVFVFGALDEVSNVYLHDFLKDNLEISDIDLEMIHNIGRFACIPVIFFADCIFNNFGQANVLITALMSVTAQFLCHVLVQDPKVSLAMEVLHYITSALVIAAAVTLATEIAPRRYFVTIVSLVYSVHYYIGGPGGLLVAQHISEKFGPFITFRELGIVSAIIGFSCGIIYFIVKICMHYKREEENGPLVLASLDHYTKPVALDTKITNVDPLWFSEPDSNKYTYQRIIT